MFSSFFASSSRSVYLGLASASGIVVAIGDGQWWFRQSGSGRESRECLGDDYSLSGFIVGICSNRALTLLHVIVQDIIMTITLMKNYSPVDRQSAIAIA